MAVVCRIFYVAAQRAPAAPDMMHILTFKLHTKASVTCFLNLVVEPPGQDCGKSFNVCTLG